MRKPSSFGFVKEVIQGWATRDHVTVRVETSVSYQLVTTVEEVVGTKHVQVKKVRIQCIGIDEVVAVWIETKCLAQAVIELELAITNQTIVGDVWSGSIFVRNIEVVFVELLNV